MDAEVYILLGAVTITSVMGIVALCYMRLLRRRMKKYVLRWENIDKYFKEKSSKKERR